MGLPASQQRALDLIEKTLADDHPSLGPLFAIFTRLVGHEAMPVTERVTARQRQRQRRRRMRRMRPGVATVVGLAMATGALLALSLMLHSPQGCAPGMVTPVTTQARSVAIGHPACATQQTKPGKTSQSGAYAH
jgi:hypothetical protein